MNKVQRMETEELINCNGGGLFGIITNLVVSVISLAKAILSLKNLRG